MNVKSIRPAELYEKMQTGEPVSLIDVRTRGEFRRVHAAGARSVPLHTLSRNAAGTTDGEPVYVICRSGHRSLIGCGKLMKAGLQNVVNVEGGTIAWRKAGLPVETAPAAGDACAPPFWRSNWMRVGGIVVVLLGLILGMTVSPTFLWIAVGAWVLLVLTGNGPCCWGAACSPKRPQE